VTDPHSHSQSQALPQVVKPSLWPPPLSSPPQLDEGKFSSTNPPSLSLTVGNSVHLIPSAAPYSHSLSFSFPQWPTLTLTLNLKPSLKQSSPPSGHHLCQALPNSTPASSHRLTHDYSHSSLAIPSTLFPQLPLTLTHSHSHSFSHPSHSLTINLIPLVTDLHSHSQSQALPQAVKPSLWPPPLSSPPQLGASKLSPTNPTSLSLAVGNSHYLIPSAAPYPH